MVNPLTNSEFNNSFKIIIADTKELKQEVFKLRYNAYAKELGWEPQNESRMESDEYDKHSLHCLLQLRKNGEYFACLRLIIPPSRTADFKLPGEITCNNLLKKSINYPAGINRNNFTELSRIVISEKFRNTSAHILTSLYLAGISLATICQKQAIFIMVEPRFKKVLTRFGFPLIAASEEMEYHGTRALYYLPEREFSNGLSTKMYALYKQIHNDLESQMNIAEVI